MNKILLVAEQCSSHFNDKVLHKIIAELRRRELEVHMLPGEDFRSLPRAEVNAIDDRDFRYFTSVKDEHRFVIALQIAARLGVEHIHFVRLTEPQKLWLALEATQHKTISISAAEYGFPKYFRFPTWALGVNRLLGHPFFKNYIIHSLAPKAMTSALQKPIAQFPGKIQVLHEMHWYNDEKLYQVDRSEARRILGIPDAPFVVLYFGAYFYSKGADILLAAAQKLINEQNIRFIFAGDIKNSSFDFQIPQGQSEQLFVDPNYIADEKAGHYFSACDLVVLPYRKTYKFNTSGVFLQACLAGRPILAPDFTPFKDVLGTYGFGSTFGAEDVDDLVAQLLKLARKRMSPPAKDYTNYLQLIENCADLIDLIIQPGKC